MEGPPVRIIAEKLTAFKGKKVESATGNARIDKSGIQANVIDDVFSRGKNLFIQFSDFSVKIHFLMYGSYRINEKKEGAKPRLSLVFESGMINFYYCSVKIVCNEEVDELYDEELDITSEKWNIDKVLRLASQMKGEYICDVLLDQNVFAGVGNIIKNEALFMARIHPLSIVEKIPEKKLKEVPLKAREFSMLFYEVRQKGERLNPYCKIYRRRQCSPSDEKVVMKRTGKRERISYFCPSCQYLYT